MRLNKDKPWNIKFVEQVKAIEYNLLQFCVSEEWRQEENGVEHPSAEIRLDA